MTILSYSNTGRRGMGRGHSIRPRRGAFRSRGTGFNRGRGREVSSNIWLNPASGSAQSQTRVPVVSASSSMSMSGSVGAESRGTTSKSGNRVWTNAATTTMAKPAPTTAKPAPTNAKPAPTTAKPAPVQKGSPVSISSVTHQSKFKKPVGRGKGPQRGGNLVWTKRATATPAAVGVEAPATSPRSWSGGEGEAVGNEAHQGARMPSTKAVSKSGNLVWTSTVSITSGSNATVARVAAGNVVGHSRSLKLLQAPSVARYSCSGSQGAGSAVGAVDGGISRPRRGAEIARYSGRGPLPQARRGVLHRTGSKLPMTVRVVSGQVNSVGRYSGQGLRHTRRPRVSLTPPWHRRTFGGSALFGGPEYSNLVFQGNRCLWGSQTEERHIPWRGRFTLMKNGRRRAGGGDGGGTTGSTRSKNKSLIRVRTLALPKAATTAGVAMRRHGSRLISPGLKGRKSLSPSSVVTTLRTPSRFVRGGRYGNSIRRLSSSELYGFKATAGSTPNPSSFEGGYTALGLAGVSSKKLPMSALTLRRKADLKKTVKHHQTSLVAWRRGALASAHVQRARAVLMRAGGNLSLKFGRVAGEGSDSKSSGASGGGEGAGGKSKNMVLRRLKDDTEVGKKAMKKKRKKKTEPCLFFCKFGKCSRSDEDCPFVHDQSKVAVCRQFLRGACNRGEACPLTHEVQAEKMPTCVFFKRGMCTTPNCPYLHVKVNKNAAVCPDFLKGYCPAGTGCRLKHELPSRKRKRGASEEKTETKDGERDQGARGGETTAAGGALLPASPPGVARAGSGKPGSSMDETAGKSGGEVGSGHGSGRGSSTDDEWAAETQAQCQRVEEDQEDSDDDDADLMPSFARKPRKR